MIKRSKPAIQVKQAYYWHNGLRRACHVNPKERVLINILDHVLGCCLFIRKRGFYLVSPSWCGWGRAQVYTWKKHNKAEFSTRGVVCAFVFIDTYILLFLWGWLLNSFNAFPLEIRRLACGELIFLANSTYHCLKMDWAMDALWDNCPGNPETWDQNHISATNQKEKKA